MPEPTIRGPKIPLQWSTTKIEGFVVEKVDNERSADNVLIEDEDSQYCTEVAGLRKKEMLDLEVMPLEDAEDLPEPGELFTYGTKEVSVTSIKDMTVKGGPMKWAMKAVHCPDIHTGP